MKKEITIPQEWSDVSLGEFIELSKLNISDYENSVDYYFKILEVFGNDLKEVKEFINYVDLTDIVNQMTFLKTPPKQLDLKSVVIDEVEFLLKDDLNKLTVGEYVSIETLIERGKLNSISAIPSILSVILRPKDEVFNADLVNTRIKLFEEKLNIEQVIKMSIFFLSGVN